MPIAFRLARIVLYPLIVYFLMNVSFAHAAPPPGFVTQRVTAGLSLPTDIAIAPDGRILITLKNGELRIFKNDALLPTPALALSVSSGGDRGFLGIALDPSFASNQFIYLLYTTSSNHQRVARFTMSGDTVTPSSEFVMLENSALWGGFLNAGGIRVGADGKLYVSFGSNGLGTQAQDLSTLDGKLTRINLDGSVPEDNPFAGTPGAHRAIYAYGFRNPWRLTINERGQVIVGDVGETKFEKIVRAHAGGNFGWPDFEGDCRPSCGTVSPPLYVIPHEGEGAAVVGGDVYHGTAFPAEYRGNYFFGDYVKGYIKRMTFNESGNPTGVHNFDAGLGTVAGIVMGREGCLYYFTIFPGELFKVCFGTTNVTIEAHASANPPFGTLPFTARFSSAGSFDPRGTPLTYVWEFGDGERSTEAHPTYIYRTRGVYTIRLTVSNANGSRSVTTTIWAGYLPPSITIDSPRPDLRYRALDLVSFGGRATDSNDGTLAPSALSWQIIFHHNDHIHSPQDFIGTAEGTFTIPHTGEFVADTWHEFRLTATNSVGLQSSTSVLIRPIVANLFITSDPVGLRILVNDQPVTTPHVLQSVAGFTHRISAPTPQLLGGDTYNFSFWSDGGTTTHMIIAPDHDATYTALFRRTTESGSFTSSATIDKISYRVNDSVLITAHITSSSSIPRARIDMELWSGESKITQFVSSTDIAANTLLTIRWTPPAPSTSGTITVKLGVFSEDWSHLFHWNDTAAAFTVTNGGTTPQTFHDRIMLDAAEYVHGAPVTLRTFVTTNQPLSEVILDTELFNASGVKIAQRFEQVSFARDIETGTAWTFTAPDSGTYSIRVGIFTSDWSSNLYWNSFAGTLIVRTPPAPAFVVSADMPKTQFVAREAGTLTTRVTATEDLPGIIVDTEIYDSAGSLVLQRLIPASLTRNTLFETRWDLATPAASDTYTVKVGVFSSDWSLLYFWRNRAFQFVVGTPPGPPQPGITYPIRIIDPPDEGTVSGVVEIKAVIDGLAIDSYTLEWRTGDRGAFFPLDTDPVTQIFKHAWIDFGPWTWFPDGRYPLEFRATNLSDNEIGRRLIHVRVRH